MVGRAQGGCCLRLYRWQEATLSLGYFQEYQDRGGHGPSRNCPVVRRLTGGGAIVHDAELTYSLVVHGGHPLAARRERLYQAAHGALIEALAALGIAAALKKGAELFSGSRSKIVLTPFLCFQRPTAGDVLVGETKIAGSAQRRRRGAVLQHGSVLLRRSAAAPELPALEDAAGKTVEAEPTGRAFGWKNWPPGSPWPGCPVGGRPPRIAASPPWWKAAMAGLPGPSAAAAIRFDLTGNACYIEG